ncbi:glycosyltransferase 87 family protein, partial [Gordonia sp. 852002-10350_SCH5691597]|uniref:glycosyltransferase 87 family protein n=2 Tax=Gordonia TaxID=2053 RepID=UPI0007EADC7C
GVVEYPVLSGMLMYLGAIGAHTDTEFFQHSALLLAPFAFAITIMLALMTRWWVLLWAATPPLVLYAFHNWELPVVATAVGAVAVMAWGASTNPRTGDRRLSLRTSAMLAAVLLGIGFCLKLYPGFFALPLALYVLTRGAGSMIDARRRTEDLDWTGAIMTAAAAAVTVIAIQLPFMIVGFKGWKAALSFQGKRKSDVDTNSIWYWGLRHFTGGQTDTYNSLVGMLSPLLILCAFALAVYLGWRVYLQSGTYPWIGVSGAMLAGFMLFHKVHSPQYTLWILPFFVLLKTRWPIIIAYLIADFLLDTTIFRLFGIYTAHAPMQWWVMAGVNIGVWVTAAIHLYLIFAFVRAPLREPLATMVAPRPRPSDDPEPVLATSS